MRLLTIGFSHRGQGNNPCVTIQTPERSYTPWWGLALAVAVALLAISGFVSTASRAPVVRGQTHSQIVGKSEAVRDGKLEFALLGIRRNVSEIGDSYFGTTANTGSYTVVTLSVRNVSRESVTFDGAYVVGVAADGSQIPSDREAQYYANEGGEGMLSTLHPGQQMRASIAFQVPDDARLMAVQVHDSVFSRGAQIAFRAPAEAA